MEKVMVSGICGSGKTTLSTTLSARLGLPRFELDAMYHGPRWVKRPEFETEVDAFSATPRWVTEDQYSGALGDLLWQRADTLVWLDLPRPTVMRRVVRRSIVRAAARRELWNGNRERFQDWLEADHPIRDAWSRHGDKRRQTTERIDRHPHLTVIRLCSGTEVRHWVSRLLPGASTP
ncbi:adenylate kinase [Actinomadura sp. HBU206391]|nr:adenylate kinase [Actinomadura sp. HBU206391]